jgi:hypothetical protein
MTVWSPLLFLAVGFGQGRLKRKSTRWFSKWIVLAALTRFQGLTVGTVGFRASKSGSRPLIRQLLCSILGSTPSRLNHGAQNCKTPTISRRTNSNRTPRKADCDDQRDSVHGSRRDPDVGY